MVRLALLLSAAALLAAQEQEVSNPRTSPQDVALGEKTFRSHCAPCHGLRGEGGRGPNLASGVFYHGSKDADLLRNISEGVPGTEMPALFYSPDRVWQVIAFIRSLSASGEAPAAGNNAEGPRLFRQQGCDGCHRIEGAGGRLGPDLTEIGARRSVEHLRQAILDPNADVRVRYWVATATDRTGQRYEGFTMNEDTYSVQIMDMSERLHTLVKSDLESYKVDKISRMPSYAGKLSEQQVNELVAFLSSQRPAGGER